MLSKAERQAYEVELERMKLECGEYLEAKPAGIDATGTIRTYMVPRIDGSVSMAQRIGCHRALRKAKGLPDYLTIIPGHNGAPATCCAHVIDQDPVHPEGFKLLPYGLFLCRTCFRLMERCKFKNKDIVMNCRDCVEDVAVSLKRINPELFDDLRKR